MVKIAIAQNNYKLANKKKNINLIVSQINKSKNGNAAMVLFPEMSLTGKKLLNLTYDMAINNNIDEMEEIIKFSKHIGIGLGAPFMDELNNIYNSYMLFCDEKMSGLYYKNIIIDNSFNEKSYLSTAPTELIFEEDELTFGLTLGEDIFISGNIEFLITKGTNVLINANNFIAGSRLEKMALELANLYSKIYGIYVIYINRIGTEDGIIFGGKSRVFSPTGDIILQFSEREDDVKFVELNYEEILTARKNLNIAGEIAKYRYLAYE